MSLDHFLQPRSIAVIGASDNPKNETVQGLQAYADQAVKHLVADAQVQIEFARPVVHAAAAELPLGTAA